MTVPPEEDEWLKAEPQEMDFDPGGGAPDGAEVIPIHGGIRVGQRRKAPLHRGDHAELGERLVMILRERAEKAGGEGEDLVVSVEGQIWTYAGGIYRTIALELLQREILELAGVEIRATKKPLKVQASDMKGSVLAAKVVAFGERFFDAAVPGMAFLASFVVVTANGIEQREHSQAHRARWSYPFSYLPPGSTGAPEPTRWLQFLREIWAGDEDVEQKTMLLQEHLGLCIIGQGTRMHTALFLVGLGANGKSVICEVFESCLPPGSVASVPIQKADQDYHKARLVGRLCNIVSELPENDIIATEAWKGLVSGDLTSSRVVFQEVAEWRPIAGHLYGLNNLPAVNDYTDGFWRRVAIIECNRTFKPEEQDKELPAKLKAERNAIIAWALEGAVRALANGKLTLPASSEAAKRRWRNEADQVRPFMAECTEPTDGTVTTPAGELYQAYDSWARRNGHRAMTSTKFGRRVKSILNMRSEEAHTRTGTRYPVRIVYANPSQRDDDGPWEYGR